MNTSLFLPSDGRCLPQSLRDWLDDASVLDLTLDLKAQTDSLDLERQLRARCAAAIAVEDGIRMGRRRIIRDLFALPIGRMSIALDEVLNLLQGGAASQDRSARSAHNAEVVGSNPTPATNLAAVPTTPAVFLPSGSDQGQRSLPVPNSEGFGIHTSDPAVAPTAVPSVPQVNPIAGPPVNPLQGCGGSPAPAVLERWKCAVCGRVYNARGEFVFTRATVESHGVCPECLPDERATAMAEREAYLKGRWP